MQPIKICYLPWDSDFFKKKIGKVIIPNKFDYNICNTIYETAKALKYNLLYVFSAVDLKKIVEKVSYHDNKIIFKKEISAHPISDSLISEFTELTPTPEMIDLALLSGKYSRFNLDKEFSKNDFFLLYKTWIEKSVNKTIADKVYIATLNEKIVGLVTCKNNSCSTKIGLLAVNHEFNGKGIGKKLVESCANFAIYSNHKFLTVETQFINQDAMSFYTKAGFIQTESIHIYHLKI